MKKLILYLLLILPIANKAQHTCSEAIAVGLSNFQKGLYAQVCSDLTSQLNSCKFTRDEKGQIFKLLSAAYYAQDELELGNQYMSDFLRLNPNYKPNKGLDPYEFTSAFPTFKVTPKFSASFALGLSNYDFERTKIYSIAHSADYTQAYNLVPAIVPKFSFEWRVFPNMLVMGSLEVDDLEFNRTIPNGDQSVIKGEEKTSFAGLGIFAGYEIPITRKFFPTVYIGASMWALGTPTTSVNTTVYTVDETTGDISSKSITSNDNNMQAQRNMETWAVAGGFRLNYKYKRLLFFSELHYTHYMLPYTNGKKYAVPALAITHNYIDDDLKFNNIRFSVGFSYIFSNHIKRNF